MSVGPALLIAVVLLIANGFFVAVEFAMIATKRAQLEELAEAGNRRAETALRAITDLNTQIAGAQLGITMASLALGLVAEPSVAKLLENSVLSGLSHDAAHTVGLIIALSIVTFLHILIGEMVPKNMALADAPRTTMWLAGIHSVFVRVARPLVWFLNALADIVLRMIGVNALDERAQAKTPEELAMLLAEAHDDDVIDEADFTLMSNSLELGEQTVREAMVPWPDVSSVPATASVESIERTMASKGHSRLVLTDADGHPETWVHAKDLLAVDSRVWQAPLPHDSRRELVELDASMLAEDALAAMQAGRHHFTLVADGGRIEGILTIEDVLKILVDGLTADSS